MKNLWGDDPKLSSVVYQGDYSLRLTPDKITVEDYSEDSINPKIVFEGKLTELVDKLLTEETIVAELVKCKIKIRELEQTIAFLEDNQIREPIR